MKNLFYLTMLVVLAGCSNKYDSLVDAARPPALGFASDTIFIRENDPTNINATGKGIVSFFCSPAGHQFFLSFTEPSGKLHFSYRGNVIPDSHPFVVTDNVNSLYAWADAPGTYPVDFTLTDQLGKSTTQRLVIHCAKSPKPVAVLNWRITEPGPYNWECQFNAGDSKQPFGMVRSYHYLFPHDTVVVTSPVMLYYLHVQGQHPVSFFVKDDLGQSSDTLHYRIAIP